MTEQPPTFWQATLNNILAGATAGVLNAWSLGAIGSLDPSTHLNIPASFILLAAGIGALSGLVYSYTGHALPGTGPASFIPVSRQSPAPRSPRRRPRKRAPKKKSPPPAPPGESGA